MEHNLADTAPYVAVHLKAKHSRIGTMQYSRKSTNLTIRFFVAGLPTQQGLEGQILGY